LHARDSEISEQICEVGKRLYDKGLIAGSEGNISCRTREGKFLITPSGLCKGTLKPEELVTLTASGGYDGGTLKPSSEYRLHLFGYSQRSDFRAAVHAHAPHATAFAVAGAAIAGELLPEFPIVFGKIPLVPFAEAGTDALARSIEPWIGKHHTFLLERHGIIAFGGELWEAYYRVETAEHCAKVLWLAGGMRIGSAGGGFASGSSRMEDGGQP
jgi:L-fuculose-phosphate aldolase